MFLIQISWLILPCAILGLNLVVMADVVSARVKAVLHAQLAALAPLASTAITSLALIRPAPDVQLNAKLAHQAPPAIPASLALQNKC